MKFKTIILSTLLLCITFIINAQNRTIQTHTVKNIQSIAVNGNIDIHIKQGNSKILKIEASEKQQEKMKVDIKDNAIKISYKSSLTNDESIDVYVEVENLNALAASSGADIIFENKIEAKNLNIALSGGADLTGEISVKKLSCATSSGSDLNFKSIIADEIQLALSGGSDLVSNNVSVTKINLVISGGSDVNFAGTCDEMSLVASGGSDFSGSNLEIKKSSVIVSGGSDVTVHVTDELSIIASGTSDVVCTGNPTIKDKKISKSADFTMK